MELSEQSATVIEPGEGVVVFLGHRVQYVALSQYVPMGHSEQGRTPVVPLYWPEGQGPVGWAA